MPPSSFTNRSKNPAIVRLLSEEDISAIVTIHAEVFPDSRSSMLGGPFLRKMYQWFLNEQPDLAIVVHSNGRPVGFAVGAIGGYGRNIFRYALPEVISGLVGHPYLLTRGSTFKAWTSLLKGLRLSSTRKHTTLRVGNKMLKASLASIAVTRSAQGKGVGKTALFAFEQAARTKGVSTLGLSVEHDNVAARRLYESCGWQLQREGDEAYYGKVLGLDTSECQEVGRSLV